MKKVFKVLGIIVACCTIVVYLGSAFYIRGLNDKKYAEAKSSLRIADILRLFLY